MLHVLLWNKNMSCIMLLLSSLTHWGRVTHICVSKLTIIDSDNGLSPGRRQAIIWTNAGILLIGPSGTNFSEILIAILTFSFKKMRLKVSSAKWQPFCLGLNVLRWVTTKKQKWCQFLENLHKYSLKYIGFNHAKQIMGYHAWFWDILTYITHEIETKPHIITHLG